MNGERNYDVTRTGVLVIVHLFPPRMGTSMIQSMKPTEIPPSLMWAKTGQIYMPSTAMMPHGH